MGSTQVVGASRSMEITPESGLNPQGDLHLECERIGRALCQKRGMTPDVRIGYGNNRLADGSDPWGAACHVAVVAFVGRGGPEIFGAGKPIVGDAGWCPLLQTHETSDGFTFRGRFTDFDTILMGTASRQLFAAEPTAIGPASGSYYSWVGFLKKLQETGG